VQPAKESLTKMRQHKLRSGVYWQGALKQKGIKQVGHKKGYMYQQNNNKKRIHRVKFTTELFKLLKSI
jgi:hypothetical protein